MLAMHGMTFKDKLMNELLTKIGFLIMVARADMGTSVAIVMEPSPCVC